MRITAVVASPPPGPSAEELDPSGSSVALRVHAVTEEQLWATMARAAEESEWTWVLGRGVSPRATALPALLAHLQGRPSRQVLVSGIVLDEDGAPVSHLLAHAPEDAPAAVLAAVAQRALPLRWAPLAHALVHRSAVLEHGVPDATRFGPFASIEWSARALRGRDGLLVPDSVAVLESGADRGARVSTARAAVAAGRVTRQGAWMRSEAIRAVWQMRARPPRGPGRQ